MDKLHSLRTANARARSLEAGASAAKKRSGFTLVEMLVVLAIVLILAVVISLAASRAIMAAQRARCASNLRNIGIALNTYAGDNNDRYPQTSAVFPFPVGTIDPATGLGSWMEQLDSYTNTNHDLFKCPSNPDTALQNSYFLSAWASFYAGGMNYPTPPENELRVTNPTATILAGDSMERYYGPVADADQDDAGQGINPPFGEPSAPWHGGYLNLLFVDGHVEAVKKFDSTTMTNRYEGVGYTYGSSSPAPDATP
jgi:prepilin-type N-terminal cleavage/methylation domain-containing protein/prepilin-type processing-associated H-X9-DG protein